jgi:AcrR family transcriptional regulator
MPRNRPDRHREDKIAEIVAAAQRQLRKGGYQQLSMKALAGELGLAQAAVYWYFPSKDELFVRAIEQQFLDAWSRKPHRAGLQRQVHWFADELVDLHPSIVALRERAQESEAAATFVAAIEHQLKSILSTALKEQTSTPNPAETAELLLAVAEGLAGRSIAQSRRRRLMSIALASLAPA